MGQARLKNYLLIKDSEVTYWHYWGFLPLTSVYDYAIDHGKSFINPPSQISPLPLISPPPLPSPNYSSLINDRLY